MAAPDKPVSTSPAPTPGLSPSDGLPEGLISHGRLGLNVLVSMRWILLGGELALQKYPLLLFGPIDDRG